MNRKLAIVGCGRIGKRHAEQIVLQGKLAAVCDVDRKKAVSLAQPSGATVYTSLEEMLIQETDLDAVAICTPNGLHAQHSIQCLEAGTHVLCEKPLCTSVADGIKMLDAASSAGKQLWVVKQNRYNPPIAYLKGLLDQAALGTIYSFQVNCYWNRPTEYYKDWKGNLQLDGGTLFTQFSHFIDLVYWLLGDVASVQTLGRNFAHPTIDFEDSGLVNFTMQSGAIGSLHYTVNSYQKNMEGSITIFGEKGTVKVGGQYLNELEYFEVAGFPTPQLPKGNPANGYGYYQGSMSNHDKVYQHLLKALENPEYPFASAREGLKTVEIIEQIYQLQR